ncbi:hypothetical protein DFH11DRAFT_1615956, partial [Phellopilus nigrolimitatus]
MSEIMFSQDRLYPHSLFLIFGAESPKNGNRDMFISFTFHDNTTFYKCSHESSDSRVCFITGTPKFEDLCFDQDIKLYRAYKLSKNVVEKCDLFGGSYHALTSEERKPISLKYLELDHMLKNKVHAYDKEHTATITWLAALLCEPLIACNLALEQDINAPGMAENVARLLFNHGNAPETMQCIFTLSKIFTLSEI